MPDVKITVLKTSTADDIFGSYAHENCERTRDKYEEGDEFVVKHDDFRVPEGLCPSAWDSISGLVLTLMHGGGFEEGVWMEDENIAISCFNDDLRPVFFRIERTD